MIVRLVVPCLLCLFWWDAVFGLAVVSKIEGISFIQCEIIAKGFAFRIYKERTLFDYVFLCSGEAAC
jgi:hypothetical protein